MALWDNDTCGYCGYTDTNLERYECPQCRRTGCVDCMPTGNVSMCNQCLEQDLDKDRRLRGEIYEPVIP